MSQGWWHTSYPGIRYQSKLTLARKKEEWTFQGHLYCIQGKMMALELKSVITNPWKMPCHWTGKGSTLITGDNSDHPTKYVNLTTTTNPLPWTHLLSSKLLVLLVCSQIFGRSSCSLITINRTSFPYLSYFQKARLLWIIKAEDQQDT